MKIRFLWKRSDNVYLPAYALVHTWHIPEGVLELMWLEGPPPPPLPQRAARRAPYSHGNRTTLLTTTGWQNWFRLVFKCSVTSLLTYPQWLSRSIITAFVGRVRCTENVVSKVAEIAGRAQRANQKPNLMVKSWTVLFFTKTGQVNYKIWSC